MIRAPLVAGTFYPSSAAELAGLVDGLLAAVPRGPRPAPRALVSPHAGYAYSGPVAASAYACLRDVEAARIALLGPSHFTPLRGLATTPASAWRTPLGEVPIDPLARRLLPVDDVAHRDHALEVQLPFLQRALDPVPPVLPVAVGLCGAAEVAEALAAIPDALVVVSTDLSHYLPDAAARQTDRRTAEHVVRLEPEAIGDRDACGAFALRGLLAWARESGLAAELLDLRTSADTAGDPARVVGYGAFALVERT